MINKIHIINIYYKYFNELIMNKKSIEQYNDILLNYIENNYVITYY